MVLTQYVMAIRKNEMTIKNQRMVVKKELMDIVMAVTMHLKVIPMQ